MKQFLIVLSLFATFTALSQTKSIKNSPPLSEANPETVGMSEERLSFIDDAVMESIEKKEIPGAVALVARKGKIVYYKAFGMADREAKRTLKKDDIFRIASQTKAITSTAVMMLWEEGKFRLDDPISKYIPEFKDPMVLDSLIEKDSSFVATKANKEISIRHLITHTSGIGYGFIDGDERFKKIYTKAGIIDGFTTDNVTIGENIRKLAKLPLHHNPGEKFTYSEGIDVLGYFIEIISGMPLDEFFKTRIFEPLDMEDTWFYLPKSKHKRLVTLQTLKDGQWETYPASDVYDPNYPITGAKAFFSGGAGLSSTAKDYATFLQMYLNQGELNGIRLLSRTTVQFMMANQIGDLWGDSGNFHGLAFGVNGQKGQDKGGEGSMGSFWWGGYFNTMYWADPEEEVIGILMKQTMDVKEDNSGWKFRQVVGQAIDD
ncbi:beta-lactamase family protein [Lutimonas saemankumensis]|uniref:serine hydrolase domain-containing protein n=1 Tax=Lutimonas saemankumensis TaxID=483016 RepID=UPI001CD1E460|nr:serine hydrolase domain-containing protein [Lutimonas saemankumensis]MCA0933314.1 beta-lactamase family protein [Lutimonas saemankumensis]